MKKGSYMTFFHKLHSVMKIVKKNAYILFNVFIELMNIFQKMQKYLEIVIYFRNTIYITIIFSSTKREYLLKTFFLLLVFTLPTRTYLCIICLYNCYIYICIWTQAYKQELNLSTLLLFYWKQMNTTFFFLHSDPELGCQI